MVRKARGNPQAQTGKFHEDKDHIFFVHCSIYTQCPSRSISICGMNDQNSGFGKKKTPMSSLVPYLMHEYSQKYQVVPQNRYRGESIHLFLRQPVIVSQFVFLKTNFYVELQPCNFCPLELYTKNHIFLLCYPSKT